MQRVIYISRSRIGADHDALDSIVRRSAARNKANGITGMLWSGGSGFAQVLEGNASDVAETMKRIRSDPRHFDIELICDCTVHSRIFGDWSMRLADTGSECTASEAFMIGYARKKGGDTAQQLIGLLLASDA